MSVSIRARTRGEPGKVGADEVVLGGEQVVDLHLGKSRRGDELIHADCVDAPRVEQSGRGVQHAFDAQVAGYRRATGSRGLPVSRHV